MGASNVDEFLPGDNSIIKTSDFPHAIDLANHLNRLAQNPEEYNKYHEWRKHDFKPSFISMIQNTYHSLPCRVCEKVDELQRMQGIEV
jgi:hypothetical protein